MGLDMYLKKVTLIKGEKPESILEEQKVQRLMEDVMYWRKAYAIMDWFETNIGQRYVFDENFRIHNCALYAFSKDDLERLKLWCERFVINPDLALDEIRVRWYEERWREYEISQCEKTIKEIENLIKDESIDYFMFHGWW